MTQQQSPIIQPAKTSRASEARAIYVAGIGAVLSAVVSLIVFYQDPRSLMSGVSIGFMATIMATLMAFVAFYVGNLGQYPVTGTLSTYKKVRNLITKSAIAFTYAAIVFLLSAAMFFIIGDAFQGLLLDWVSSAALVAIAVGVSSYIVYIAAYQIDTFRVSTALAVFMASGVLTSMVTADDPYWWQLHFSSLGADGTRSSFVFNATLVISGLVIVALSDFIASDFARLKQVNQKHQRDRANILRVCFALIGLFLMGVGLFIYNVYPLVHTLSAGGMALIFIGITAFSRQLMPSFSGAFFGLSYVFLAVLLGALWLFKSVGYLSLTAFELSCFAIIFSWIIVFIRQIGAELEGSAVHKQPKAKLVRS